MTELKSFEKENKFEKEKGDKLKQFAESIRNKLVVLYGAPFVGKTTLAHALTKYFCCISHSEIGWKTQDRESTNT